MALISWSDISRRFCEAKKKYKQASALPFGDVSAEEGRGREGKRCLCKVYR